MVDASPFRDAGYDVSDYLRIAPRYGTNEDMARLVEAARERGTAAVLVTHNPAVAAHANRVVELHSGHLDGSGPS